MLDQIKVEYYGTQMPINQIAQVSAPEAQLIVISPFDPSILKEIEKALQGGGSRLQPACPMARLFACRCRR
jgi:ribosome recycling factor